MRLVCLQNTKLQLKNCHIRGKQKVSELLCEFTVLQQELGWSCENVVGYVMKPSLFISVAVSLMLMVQPITCATYSFFRSIRMSIGLIWRDQCHFLWHWSQASNCAHLLICFIQHGVMAVHKRSIVWSFFTAISENITNCVMCEGKPFTTVATPQSYLNTRKNTALSREERRKWRRRRREMSHQHSDPWHWDTEFTGRDTGNIQVYTVKKKSFLNKMYLYGY